MNLCKKNRYRKREKIEMRDRSYYAGWLFNLLLFALVLFACSCGGGKNTVSCGRGETTSALMSVAVDWSDSGIEMDSSATRSRGATDYDVGVHRVSFRFFLLESDGSTSGVFERYIETSVYDGTIQVPVGRYAIVVMNESSTDSYWSGSLQFENSDDFESFAAVLPTDSDGNSSAALPLAAWSVAEFEVTSNMAAISRGVVTSVSGSSLSDYELEQIEKLQQIKMQRRTRTMNVSVSATNLGSVQKVAASISGLSTRVYLASGAVDEDGVTHTFDLDSWSFDSGSSSLTRAGDDSGVVSGSRLCLGHSDANDSHEDYSLSLEVYQNDGKRFEDDEQLSGVAVGEQFLSITDGLSDYDISHSVAFDYVSSDGIIDVDGWVSNGDIELN